MLRLLTPRTVLHVLLVNHRLRRVKIHAINAQLVFIALQMAKEAVQLVRQAHTPTALGFQNVPSVPQAKLKEPRVRIHAQIVTPAHTTTQLVSESA